MFVWGTKYSIFILLFYCSRCEKYESNCTPGTVWMVISSTSALAAALWSTTFRQNPSSEQRKLQENPNQPHQRRWQLGHKESKAKMTGVAAPALPRSSSSGGREAPPLLLSEGISQLCQGLAPQSCSEILGVWLGKAFLSCSAVTTCTGHCNLNGSTGSDLPQWIISVPPVHRMLMVCAQGNMKQLLVWAWI